MNKIKPSKRDQRAKSVKYTTKKEEINFENDNSYLGLSQPQLGTKSKSVDPYGAGYKANEMV